MSNIDPNWYRWFMSSIYDHFKKGVIDPISQQPLIKINFDNEDQQTTAGRGKTDSLEFKHMGPDFRFIAANECDVTITINIMVVTYMAISDPFRNMTNVGLAQSLFTPCIPIFKYGPNEDIDDRTQLTLIQTDDNNVKTTSFGTLDPTSRLLRTTVESTYKGILEGDF